MPLVTSGIIKYEHLRDKIKRRLVLSEAPLETIDEALDNFMKIIEEIVGEGIKPEDVVSVEAEYSVENDRIVWVEESIKVKVYKPEEELKEAYESKIKSLEEESEEYKRKINELKSLLEEFRDKITKALESL